ncbi:MAG: hypothetical protein JW863_22160 [Chitinispirillaceae bacterium]|nr:hypothetical protein [Chitinispirillaceae bacterium]
MKLTVLICTVLLIFFVLFLLLPLVIVDYLFSIPLTDQSSPVVKQPALERDLQ